MTTIRIETANDDATGLVYALVYVGDSPEPVLRSDETFSSNDELVSEVLTMCRTRWPDKTPFAVDPTIGV